MPKRICHSLFLLILGLSATLPVAAQQTTHPRESPPAFEPFDQVETHRIRITNAADGLIEISQDSGTTWRTIGRVTVPATDSLMGYLASGYAKPGTVCATAVHGIRVRIGDLTSAYPRLVNILPREFAQTPVFFGGHVSGSSGIYTTLPVGTSIFRELSPYAGSPVYLEGEDHSLAEMPIDYSPHVRDILVIVVKRPSNPLTEVDFENVPNGKVTGTFADGTSRKLTSVIKPVYGVGRFDGTSYTGVGAINTNHTGVITVSTSPVSTSKLFEGTGEERRGGFQIQPAFHNSQSDEAWADIAMVIGSPKKQREPDLEGTPPLFLGYFDLAWSPTDLVHSWHAEVRRGSGSWEPMPQLVGNKPKALLGIKAIRLIRKNPGDIAWRSNRIADAVRTYTSQRFDLASTGKISVKRGQTQIEVTLKDPRAKFVAFYVDGNLRAMSNTAPYILKWDTQDTPDGEHIVEARAEDDDSTIVATTTYDVWVDNQGKIR